MRAPETALAGTGFEPSPEAGLLATERRTALVESIGRLPETDRDVIAFRYLLELSEAETAAALGVPVGTAKSRLSRAMNRLRATMANEDWAP